MSADVIVVGGGAIGVSAAYELARSGCTVTLLERGETLAAECSAGNGGVVSPSHAMPLANPEALRAGLRSLLRRESSVSMRLGPDTLVWLARYAASSGAGRAARGRDALQALSRASLELHAEHGSALGTSFERCGTLNVCETVPAFEGVSRAASGTGEVLSAAEACALEPALAAGIAGAVLHADEGYVNPVRFVNAMGDGARAAGAELRTGIEVRSLRRGDGTLLADTSAGELRAGTVVLAAGVWTATLARSLGVLLPLIAAKGHHVDFAPGDGDPHVPLLFQESRLVASPFEDRLRLAGRIEFTGIDPVVREREIAAIRAAGLRLLPGLERRAVLETWAGLRPCTSDGVPVIGRVAAVPGLVIASGHAMKGVALAPVTARLVAELVTGARPSHELAPFSPERFRRPTRRR